MGKLDLSKFKKVRSGEKHTVLRHPAGHEITIFHKALSKPIKAQLDKLPNHEEPIRMKDGGELDSDKKEKYQEASAQGGIQQAQPTPSPIDKDRAKEVQNSMRKAFHFEGGGTPSLPGAQSAQDSMRKAFKFEEGGAPAMAGGEGPNGQLDPLEAQYAMENFNAKEMAQDSVPGQVAKLEQEVPITPASQDNSHAHLAEAVKNLSQKFIPQSPSDSVPVQDSVGIGNQQPMPSQPAAQVNDPGAPKGTLPEQAQADVGLANKADLASAQNTQQALGQEANIHGKEAQQLQDLQARTDENGNNLLNKFHGTSDAVEKGQIDPGRWWNSKSTGSQVLTAIGMLFAGAGLGASGHPELASKAIDDAINRDIDAQKSDLSNKNTLLSKYMDMYNNIHQAETATRLTLGAATEGLLKQNAAKLGSANAVNTAMQVIAARRQALLPQMEGLAKGQVMGQMYKDMSGPQLASNNGPEQDYQNQMQRMRILNPDLGKDMENKYLPGVGASRVPVPDKLREEISTRKDLSDKLGQLENFARQHQGSFSPSIVNQGKAMAAQVQDAYRTAHQQGVFKESEKNFLEGILHKDPTAFFADIRTIPGYHQARKFNDDTVKQYYKSYGIKPFEGHSDIQDASSSNTATMNGVQYRKVPGGWERVK